MQENKLIAEFMDLETPDGVYYEYLTKDGHRSELTHFILLEYHLRWDWLMPVVDKIFSLGYDYEIKPRYMMIKERMSSELLVCEANFKGQTYNKSQKDIIYDAVVEFIKQYKVLKNKNQKKDE